MDKCQCHCHCDGLLPPEVGATASILGILSAIYTCVDLGCRLCWWCCMKRPRFRNITNLVTTGEADRRQIDQFQELVQDPVLLGFARARRMSLSHSGHTEQAERLRVQLDEAAAITTPRSTLSRVLSESVIMEASSTSTMQRADSVPTPVADRAAAARGKNPSTDKYKKESRTVRPSSSARQGGAEPVSRRSGQTPLTTRNAIHATGHDVENQLGQQPRPRGRKTVGGVEMTPTTDQLAATRVNEIIPTRGSQIPQSSRTHKSGGPVASGNPPVLPPGSAKKTSVAKASGNASARAETESLRDLAAASSSRQQTMAASATPGALGAAGSGSPSAHIQRSSPSFQSARSSQTE